MAAAIAGGDPEKMMQIQHDMDTKMEQAMNDLVIRDQVRHAKQQAEEAAAKIPKKEVAMIRGASGVRKGDHASCCPKGDDVISYEIRDHNLNANATEESLESLLEAADKENDDNDWDEDDTDDAIMARLREKRIAELKAKKLRKMQGAGEFREITEDEFLKQVTSFHMVAVHFYHNEFMKCKIMDQKLQLIARMHDEAKFLKINAEKAPFFVGKLGVLVLPTVVLFRDGVAFGRVVGFQNLGGGNDTTTRMVEERLIELMLFKDGAPNFCYPDDGHDPNKFDDDSDDDM